MFVVQMDISWLDSPFLTHSKRIKNSKDIESIKKAGVRHLLIDLSKGCDVSDADALVAEPVVERVQSSSAANPLPKQADQPPVSLGTEKTELNQELKAAVAVRGKIKNAINNLQKSIEQQKPVNTEELLPLVDETLASLERNDQALMTLVHLSRKAQKLADHAFGCFCLTLNFANAREVAEQEKTDLGMAALLHEVGWAQLPLNLVGSRTRYTPAQESLIKKHIFIAEKMLKSSTLPELTRRIIHEHHERIDGSGYPEGIKGEAIHPLSKLFSIIDVYEERVHQLADQPGMIATNALRSLYLDADKGLFEKELVAAFINMLGIYPVTTPVLLNTGEKGIVVEVNHDEPLNPSVKIFYNGNGDALKDPQIVHLTAKDNGEADDVERNIVSAIDLKDKKQDPKQLLMVDPDEYF